MAPSHLRAVLLHELAHLKRGDLWVNSLQTLLQIVYFYNPLLWWANALIRQVREQAVNERVLVALGQEGERYTDTLLHVAKQSLSRPALSLGLVGTHHGRPYFSAHWPGGKVNDTDGQRIEAASSPSIASG